MLRQELAHSVGSSLANFSLLAVLPRSARQREECSWSRPMSPPFNFPLPNIRCSCAAPSSPPPSARRSNGTISFSTAPSPAWSLPSCSSRTRTLGSERSRPLPSAVGFVARPVGAAIFGHYGDRIGRKSTLIATLLLMGLATFAVALVPTYESI